jgi:hypothetical protein
MKDEVKMKGTIEVIQTRNGKEIERRLIENTITKTGMAQMALLAGDAAAVPFTYLEVGIGTTGATADDTALESAITDTGLERAAATVSRVTTTNTNDTLQLLKTWTSTGAKAVTECGAFNAASTGTMLGRQVFSAINVANGDGLTVTYKFKFS